MNNDSKALLEKYNGQIGKASLDGVLIGYTGVYTRGKRNLSTKQVYKTEAAARQGLLALLRKLNEDEKQWH